MDSAIPLHVVFTMDCQPAATTTAPEGPKSWEQSARSIDGFCTRLLNAGYPPTLFVTPWCAEQHDPLMEELATCGVELGLYVQPQSLIGGGYGRYLGQYGRDEQRTIVSLAMSRFQDALGHRPQSCRPAMFSASDDTFSVLHELGFRQGSVSSPGRQVPLHEAVWTGAPADPHYVDSRSRLRSGDLAFLEVPVTTDATQVRGRLSPDLAIENGTCEAWHRPLIEGQLGRMEAEGVSFRTLCFVTRNCFAYHGTADRTAVTLDALIEYLASLGERYEVIAFTLSDLHASFRTR
jgi:hypothetical protein